MKLSVAPLLVVLATVVCGTSTTSTTDPLTTEAPHSSANLRGPDAAISKRISWVIPSVVSWMVLMNEIIRSRLHVLPVIGSEAVSSVFEVDGVLSQRPGSLRHFILDLSTTKGAAPQVFPVVFDTGSDTTWIASENLARLLQPPRAGYSLPGGVPLLAFPKGDIEYVSTKTNCGFWADESMATGPEPHVRSWDSPLCVTEKTGVAMRAITGVLGSDLESPFVKAHKVFWLLPREYPQVALVLRDRLLPEWVCEGEMRFARVHFFSNIWVTTADIQIGDRPVKVHSARIDTGVNRVYLPKPLWDDFNQTLVAHGITIQKASVASEYYSTQCENTSTLPSILLTLGEFRFELSPDLYVQHFPSTRQCTFQIYNLPDPADTEALIGAPLLTRVVSFWDSVGRRMGFCLPKHNKGW